MADTGKKVEVRYGAFACTIEGYDNPAEQLEAILGKMQKMIAETPQFSQVGGGSEPEDIQEALHPSEDDERPSPGIVVIRDSDEGGSTQPDPEDDTVSDAEEVTEAAPAAPDSLESEATDEPGDAAGDDEVAVEVSDDVVEHDDTQASNDEGSGLGGLATGAAAVASAAGIFSTFGSAEASEEPDPSDTYEDQDATDQPEPASEPEPSAWDVPQAVPAEQSAEPELGEDEAFDDPATSSEPEPETEPQAVNIFSTPDDVPSEPESASDAETHAEPAPDTTDQPTAAAPDIPGADVNIFASPADAVAAPQEDADQVIQPSADAGFSEAAAAVPEQASDAVNIFAEPRDVANTPVNIFAAPAEDAAPGEQQSDALAASHSQTFGESASEPSEPSIFAAPEPDPEPEASEPNIFAAPEFESTANIFASPETTEAAEAPPAVVDDSEDNDAPVNIFAAPEDSTETDGVIDRQESAPQQAAADVAEETVNIFAAPAVEAAAEIKDQAEQAAGTAADVWDDATDALEKATPNTVRQTLDDLGARVSQLSPSPADAMPSTDAAPFSIFADPPAEEADPADAPAPGDETNNRFQELLQRNQGGPVMGAPGEPDSTSATAPETGTVLAAGIASAGDLAQRVGSESVSDLLAASAAWLTLAQGKPRFSRREVMDVFEEIPGEHPRTLEARIKGYGKLVRSGMLVLVDDGVFAMAQSERDRFQTALDRG